MAEKTDKKHKSERMSGGSGGAMYVLGLIGALIFYFQQADTFWLYVAAVLKALVWPAFVVYDLLNFIHG
jgi:hypothetical protein